MQKEDSNEILFAKLMGHKFYNFSAVADQKPVLSKKHIPDFSLMPAVPPAENASQGFSALITAIENQHPNRKIKLRQELKILLAQLVAKAPTKFSEGGNVETLIKALAQVTVQLTAFAQLVYTIAIIDDKESALEVQKWFKNLMELYDIPLGFQGKVDEEDFDYYKFLGQELYIILIAALLKEEKWLTLQKLFSEWMHVDFRREGPTNLTYKDISVFVASIYYEGEKRHRISLQADLYKEHFQDPNLSEICSFNDFMEADLFMFMMVEIPEEKVSPYFNWRPVSFLYMHHSPLILIKAQKINYAGFLSDTCGAKDVDIFKQRMLMRLPKLDDLFNGDLRHSPISNGMLNRIGTIHS